MTSRVVSKVGFVMLETSFHTSSCHAINTQIFSSDVFIVIDGVHNSNQPVNINSHLAILSNECNTQVVLYETK